MMNIILSILCLLVLASCSVTTSHIMQEVPITLEQKQTQQIACLSKKPSKSSFRIGTITIEGKDAPIHQAVSFDTLMQDARKKAAKLGGDYILLEDQGAITRHQTFPGKVIFRANKESERLVTTTKNMLIGGAQSIGDARFESRDAYTIEYSRPWAIFSVWVYTHAELGLQWDESHVIQKIHLHSAAENVGINIGDRILGIDGLDINDEKLIAHLLSIHPGSFVCITLQQNNQRVEKIITAF